MPHALRLGFLPLTDCAVLVAALEQGFFDKQGLTVTLQREVSWANIRDRLAFGELDAAHMLAPMPLAATLGIDGLGVPMLTAFSLGLNGSAITLSSALMAEIRTACPAGLHAVDGLKILLTTQTRRKPVFACVYPFSQHHYLLRAWLQSAGLQPGTDVEIQVIPPSQMVDALASGQIDGCCVGEPWNQIAVSQGVGQIAVSSYELWNNGPDKVLGVTQAWAEAYPEPHLALLRALLEAAHWLESSHHRARLAEILASPTYLDTPVALIRAPLLGHCRYALDEPTRFLPDFNVFARYAATFPWHSHGAYFLAQMQAAGQAPAIADTEAASLLARVYRSDLYRTAASSLSLPYPLADYLPHHQASAPWILHEASQPIAMGSQRTVFAL